MGDFLDWSRQTCGDSHLTKLAISNRQPEAEMVVQLFCIDELRHISTEEIVELMSQLKQELDSRGGVQGEQTASVKAANLSKREQEVLAMLGKGITTREIAAQLELSIHTVETYREKIKTKLGLKNAAELWHYATRCAMAHTL